MKRVRVSDKRDLKVLDQVLDADLEMPILGKQFDKGGEPIFDKAGNHKHQILHLGEEVLVEDEVAERIAKLCGWRVVVSDA